MVKDHTIRAKTTKREQHDSVSDDSEEAEEERKDTEEREREIQIEIEQDISKLRLDDQ